MTQEEDIHLTLLANEPVFVADIGYIRSPKLRDVIKLGYSNYIEALSSLLFDKSRISGLGTIMESAFVLACYFFMQDDHFRNSFSNGIRLLLHKEIELVEMEGVPYFDLGDGLTLHEGNFHRFQEIVKIANKAELTNDEEDYNPGNSKAREMIEKLMKGKANKPAKRPVINLHSIISGLSWKSTSGININNIFELSIYQFYDGYYRLENIDHYNSVVTGIYTGNIDAKKINMQEINWTKIIY
ncbi:hypothetical protein [Paenibacillus bouchesdurhonensis]|uniref:hypothetical protein n=1 Tax=Paenibacillus bouchesdurhonensis TaxID=1870990 RepID=UPI00190287B1|nr:hypothetical protein [Paenibacillus bouchesdurhonensis]